MRECDRCGLGGHPAAAHWCRCCGALLPRERRPDRDPTPVVVLVLVMLSLGVLALWGR